MKLSKRGEYALRALIDLGVARELGRPLLSIREFSAKEKTPVAFLEQIFFQLREAGTVGSVRGKQGGYTLARSADAILFGEIKRPENKGKLIVTISCSTGERYLSTALAEEARQTAGS